jgi:hypothetical protein
LAPEILKSVDNALIKSVSKLSNAKEKVVMSKEKVGTSTRKAPPARTPEELEKRCINLAMSQAEKMLEDGTAPNSMILHYLKLGTSETELKKIKLEHEAKMLEAKTQALEEAVKYQQVAEKAMAVFKGYGPQFINHNEDEIYEESE